MSRCTTMVKVDPTVLSTAKLGNERDIMSRRTASTLSRNPLLSQSYQQLVGGITRRRQAASRFTREIMLGHAPCNDGPARELSDVPISALIKGYQLIAQWCFPWRRRRGAKYNAGVLGSIVNQSRQYMNSVYG
jgi:hypothetical protein